jgi:hypothetical protein
MNYSGFNKTGKKSSLLKLSDKLSYSLFDKEVDEAVNSQNISELGELLKKLHRKYIQENIINIEARGLLLILEKRIEKIEEKLNIK